MATDPPPEARRSAPAHRRGSGRARGVLLLAGCAACRGLSEFLWVRR
jgi:hypothetical protein